MAQIEVADLMRYQPWLLQIPFSTTGTMCTSRAGECSPQRYFRRQEQQPDVRGQTPRDDGPTLRQPHVQRRDDTTGISEWRWR